jgi:hypothetical protein
LNNSLYWSIALQILGHDAPIKETYQALITSDQRPMLFIDVGGRLWDPHNSIFVTRNADLGVRAQLGMFQQIQINLPIKLKQVAQP